MLKEWMSPHCMCKDCLRNINKVRKGETSGRKTLDGVVRESLKMLKEFCVKYYLIAQDNKRCVYTIGICLGNGPKNCKKVGFCWARTHVFVSKKGKPNPLKFFKYSLKHLLYIIICRCYWIIERHF